ncbi:MAG: helix-turn-helix domain-containing protein [Flavobacteriaceae bacterium]
MDKFSIIGFITLVILFTSILFAFFLLTVKTKKKLSNNLLATYFGIFSIHFSAYFYTQYIELPLVIEMLRDNIIWLLSPILFLYLLSNIYSDFRLRIIHLLHVLPFVLEIILFTPRFYGVSESERIIFSENYEEQPEVTISVIFNIIVSVFYLILMFRELKKYKYLLKENYSNTSIFNYKWLYQLTLFITFIFIFSQFKQVYKLIDGNDLEVLNVMRLTLTLLLLSLLSWVVLKSMYQPELFKSIDTNHKLIKPLITKKTIDVHQNNNEDVLVDSKIKKLQKFMEDEEPFLDPALTIQKLANQFNLPSKELSILINHHLDQHFFDFITNYRIKKAITLFKEPSNKKMTILEVLYDVGFNSKSPFNKAFKKHTGLTPTDFRVKYT